MISGRLLRLIEQNREPISERVLTHIRRDSELTNLRALFESELRTWCYDLLQHLGRWLESGTDQDLARRYERFGKRLMDQEIPLSQGLRGLFLVREKILDFLEEQFPPENCLDLYAEEQMERRLGRFFDLLMTHLARGYENALHQQAAAR